jgi:hypothetical protein
MRKCTHRERRRTRKKDAALRFGIERYLHTAIGGIICKTLRSTSALVHILPLVMPRLIIPEPILPPIMPGGPLLAGDAAGYDRARRAMSC